MMAKGTGSDQTERAPMKESSMTVKRVPFGILCLALAMFAGGLVYGQSGTLAELPEQGVEQRLSLFADRLHLGLAAASVAVHSPTLGDLQLHAQQLAALLRGFEGQKRALFPGYEGPGLIAEAESFSVWITDRAFEREAHKQTLAAARTVEIYLDLAYDATQSVLRQRRLDQAGRDMYRVYAYLSAAYARPCEPAYVPGLWTLLRVFGIELPRPEE
jgi:hypothetical protein